MDAKRAEGVADRGRHGRQRRLAQPMHLGALPLDQGVGQAPDIRGRGNVVVGQVGVDDLAIGS